jgi:hypothetical protein
MIKVNDESVKPAAIVDQLNERRPLPIGMTEFNEWADRIISGALLLDVDKDSQVYALATMILTLGPHESHKEDAFFIHGLRKSAANQVADAKRKELYEVKKKKEEEEKAKQAAAANPEAQETLDRAKGLTLVKDTSVLDNK